MFFHKLFPALFLSITFLGVQPNEIRSQNRNAKAIMKYLRKLPSKTENRLISGQFERWGSAVKPLSSPENFLNIVHSKTGKWVGLVGIEYHNGRQVNFNAPNQLCTEYWNMGGLCQLYLIMTNPADPWTHNGGGTCDIKSVLDPGHPYHKHFFDELDKVADGLEILKGNGVVLFMNMFAEATGTWFWWGGKDTKDFIALYRATHDYLVKTRGLNNLLFIYEPSSQHETASDFYPGDEYVDMIGISLFIDHDEELSPNSIPNYRQLKTFGKTMALSQWGPRRGSDQTRGQDQPPADNLKLIRGIQNYFPEIVWWMNWCYAYSISTQHNSNFNDTELLNHPWVLNLDEIEWRKRGSRSVKEDR
ncbi:MAG TPA: glycosyl hydrolase [Cyclobacteriaceae bacterium]|nr:glycosyl hydrolase [Cyclobacteriaceae bacterium]